MARFVGGVGGSVQDAAGIPQMGAVVQLFNRFEKPLDKVLTNVRGEFGFDGLMPDVYAIRVSLNSFMPALKRGIAVQPGMRSILAINLATVLSSIDLLYSAPNPGTLMSDDWKWVLRGAMSTRPILRIIPVIDLSESGQGKTFEASVFSDTRGVVRLSSGDANPFSALANQPDLGTTFALATSFFGNNQLQLAETSAMASAPSSLTAGFRTSFSRADIPA
ncbi:MAG: carboxypeptidase-like regulatory domain-containing protein [Bryobacteraceae bacterium]